MKGCQSAVKVVIVVLMGLAVLLVEFRHRLVSFAPNTLSTFVHRYGNMKYLQDEPTFRKLQTAEHKIHGGTGQHGIHFNHSGDHRSAWMHLEEVDGLKNTEVVMVVTSTVIKDGYLLRERVIASSRTWMRMFAHAIVVIEDTFEIRFAMRTCEITEHDLYTTFKCHNEPLYLLSRVCTSDYYGARGPCCKVDDAVNYLVNIRQDLFKNVKFMLHCDDDMYWRPDQVFRWLAAVENSGINKYPLISNLDPGDANNKGVWMIDGCTEVRTTGWYQPAMLNHALLQRMGASTAAYGIRDTCQAFDVTHDVGLGIFAWMHGAYHIQMPQTYSNGDHQGIGVFKPTDMAMHCVKHHERERCDGKADNGWPAADRYSQNIVIGCGDIGHPVHGHDQRKRADMYDAWEYYKVHGVDIVLNHAGTNEFIESCVVTGPDDVMKHVLQEGITVPQAPDGTYSTAGQVKLIDDSVYTLSSGEKIVSKVIPRMLPLRGYSTTKHSIENDITKAWKPFTLNDCSTPGTKSKR